VPILDLQAENDAVVIPNILKSMLGDRVEHKTIARAGHAMAPERPREMANAIALFAKKVHSNQNHLVSQDPTASKPCPTLSDLLLR